MKQADLDRNEIIDKDEVLKMAKLVVGNYEHAQYWPFFTEELEHFAKLVTAKAVEREREACARVAEDTDRMVLALLNVTSQPKHIASAIRARKQL